MARTRRGLKGGVAKTTIVGAINDSVTTIPGLDLSTWVGTTTNGPSTATINLDESDEETITFTGVSGGNLTGVTRGAGGTTAQQHAAGASLRHTSSVTDLDEANELVAAMANNSARVYNNANISIPDATFTALTFNSERYDTGGLHSTSVNSGRLTCVTAGKYLITASVEFAANATGYRQIALAVNAVTLIGGQLVPTSSGSVVTQLTVTSLYHLAVNDYVVVLVGQNSGGALDVNATGNLSPEFGMSFVGF